MIPNDIESLRSGLSLVGMAEQAGAEFRQVGGELRSKCPIHRGDNPAGFAIYEAHGRPRWKCFTRDCNERGGGSDEFAFLVALTGKSFAQVLADLRGGATPKAPITPLPPTPEEIARRLEIVEKELAEQRRRLDEIDKWRERESWQQYHDNAPGWAVTEWEKAGIRQDMQAFWCLGGVESFAYTATNGARYATPTLTIPVFVERRECVTVRHRLLRPADANDKYRPDITGLGSHPFLADYDLGYDAQRTIVVEGEKKAMVLFQTLDMGGVQVIGIPGKGIWKEVAKHLHGKTPIIMLDPDANQQACQMARDAGGGKVVEFSHKIDDSIVKHHLDRKWAIGLLKNGKFVV